MPFISFGSCVWGIALKKKTNSKLLRRVQRRILLRVISGYRTISYDSVFALAGFPPIDVVILQNIFYNETLDKSSDTKFDFLMPISSVPHPTKRNPIKILNYNNGTEDQFPVVCFTDGSKRNNKTGFAFVV